MYAYLAVRTCLQTKLMINWENTLLMLFGWKHVTKHICTRTSCTTVFPSQNIWDNGKCLKNWEAKGDTLIQWYTSVSGYLGLRVLSLRRCSCSRNMQLHAAHFSTVQASSHLQNLACPHFRICSTGTQVRTHAHIQVHMYLKDTFNLPSAFPMPVLTWENWRWVIFLLCSGLTKISSWIPQSFWKASFS